MPETLSEVIVAVDDLRVNLTTHSVMVAGRPIKLTPKEQHLLELLARRQGTDVFKARLFELLYHDVDDPPDMKIIDVFVRYVRRKLDKEKPIRYIETIWGRGYRLRAD